MLSALQWSSNQASRVWLNNFFSKSHFRFSTLLDKKNVIPCLPKSPGNSAQADAAKPPSMNKMQCFETTTHALIEQRQIKEHSTYPKHEETNRQPNHLVINKIHMQNICQVPIIEQVTRNGLDLYNLGEMATTQIRQRNFGKTGAMHLACFLFISKK